MNMATRSFLLSSLCLLLFTSSLASVSIASPPSFPLPQCHDDEAYALLQFKQSLAINICDPSDPSAYPKLESWKMLGGRSNCCSWDGVECDDTTGHVIGLHLGSSCLRGSLSFNSTLSKLSKLGHLNLAFNNFGQSSIPSLSVHFSQLAYLNLSYSRLSGLVPPSISQLSKLSFLDLTDNDRLIFKKQNFEALVENLTLLEYLDLGHVDISSTVPKSILNLSNLNTLFLHYCQLCGQFPEEIFNMNYLKHIALGQNLDLVGHFPQFNFTGPLEEISLPLTRFTGLLPASIGELHSLNSLSIARCNFYGKLPTSLQNLTQLMFFDLSFNKFAEINPSSLSWLSKRTRLVILNLGSISLQGEVPSYLANMTQLAVIGLQLCQLRGSLPPWLFTMNKLQLIGLGHNELHGPIPDLFSQMTQLTYLDLSHNNFNGKVELKMFLGLEKLTSLYLSGNSLSLIHQANANTTTGKFLALGLGSCNLQQFPPFLHDQDQLTWLDLTNNSLHGLVPQWMWNLTKDTLEVIILSSNFLVGFETDPSSNVFPWSQATMIWLNDNMFQGPLLVPPSSSRDFSASGNNFTGEIPPVFCSLGSLYSLDLSYNYLNGEVPQCLANFSSSLELLVLGGNNFHGSIPQTHTTSCNLKMLVLDNNNFRGKLPKSLSNCSGMKFLSLGDNQIEDGFPSWLGALEQLKILILRSNRFHGELKAHKIGDQFPKLRVIDISWNNLSGPLPTQYLTDWNAMKTKEINGVYMEENAWFEGGSLGSLLAYHALSMTLTNKGKTTTYYKIIESFVAIDFSGNRFKGHIPISIGSLKGLHLLNLSNNVLTGPLPSSLANLSNLEALDLSQNNLSGEIPQDLARLTFLSFFNVSHNHLTGSIPHGNQFGVFQNDSYIGNQGLCGRPLSKQCGTAPPPPPSSVFEKEGPDQESFFHFSWTPVVIGYACGFVFGIGLGYLVYTRKHVWIVKIFGEKRK